MSKSDIMKFIESMKFGWDEPTILFYLLNVFEKSGERLEEMDK